MPGRLVPLLHVLDLAPTLLSVGGGLTVSLRFARSSRTARCLYASVNTGSSELTVVDQVGAEGAPEEAGSTPVAQRPSLFSLLVEVEVASEHDLRMAVAEGMGTGERLGEVVLRRGWIDEEGLARLLALQWRLPFLGQDVLGLAVVERELLPFEEARRLSACAFVAEGVRSVAVAEPTSDRVNELRELAGDDATVVVVTEASLKELLDQLAAEPEQALPAEETAFESLAIEDAQAAALIAEVETATAALAALAQRVEQLTASRQVVDHELVELRDELERLNRQREQEQALARERDQTLEHERARNETIKTKVADLLRELDG